MSRPDMRNANRDDGVPHPYADFGGPGFVVTESRAPVVHLSAGRISLLHQAVADGNRLALVTDELCRLTPAFAEVWREAGAAWVVRSDDGLREGFDGAILDDIEAVFDQPATQSIDDVDLRFLSPAVPDTIEMIMYLGQRHRADIRTLVGTAANRLSEVITGQPLRSWGPHEPAAHAWNRERATDFVRSQMPGPIIITATGPTASALITTHRTADGVEETTRLHASLGAVEEGRLETLVDAVSTYLSELAETAMPLVGTLMVRPGHEDLMVRPFLPLPPQPLLLLIGPPGIRTLDVDLDTMTEQFGAIRIGRPRIPGLLLPLAGTEHNGWQRLDEVLATVDRAKLDQTLGLPQHFLPPEVQRGE